jgi:hypothetical protein
MLADIVNSANFGNNANFYLAEWGSQRGEEAPKRKPLFFKGGLKGPPPKRP